MSHQTLKNGADHSFGEFLRGVELPSLRWSVVATSLSEAFGPERITIIDYTALAARKADPRAVFMSAVGDYPALAFPEADPANAAYSDRAIAMARAMRPYLNADVEIMRFRRFLERNFSAKNDGRPQLVGAADRSILDAQYRLDLAEIEGLGIRILREATSPYPSEGVCPG